MSRDVSAARRPPALVLYDGECALCHKSVELLKRCDWLKRLDFANARDADKVPVRQPPLDPKRLLDEMHLITPDGRNVYHGYEAFRWLAWRLPLFCWLAPLLYVPGVPALGQRVYLWVARNRFQLVPCHDGVCTLPPRGAPYWVEERDPPFPNRIGGFRSSTHPTRISLTGHR
jgi:predicted DCC family thiol-disulfide oxidoreductase YuxK